VSYLGVFAETLTCDIDFEDFESLFIHVKAIKDAFFGARNICSCRCDYRQICGFQQVSGKLEANATRRGRCEDPWLRCHDCQWTVGIGKGSVSGCMWRMSSAILGVMVGKLLSIQFRLSRYLNDVEDAKSGLHLILSQRPRRPPLVQV